MKVLICTAWSPTKSRCFPKYAEGISRVLHSSIPTELYITSTMVDEKFESIVKSMAEAQYYAMYSRCTHLLNVEADRLVPEGTLEAGLDHNKDVVLFTPTAPKRGEASLRQFSEEACREMNPGGSGIHGWGTMLVSVDTLRQVPFEEGYHGNYCWPDVMWFRKLKRVGIDIWIDRTHTIELLEPASPNPGVSFAPGLKEYVDKQLEGASCR